MAREIETVAGKLARAAELGRRIRAIRDERSLWILSRSSWRGRCLALAGWSLEDLEAARDRVASMPYLSREIAILGRLWAGGHQDHPAPAPNVFRDGERFAAAYSERLAARLSVEQCSALAAWHCAELRPDATFGRADNLDDGERALAPHLSALADLDAELVTLVRVGDLTWGPDGRPELRTGGLVIAVDQSSAARLASAIAEAAQLLARLPVAA